jgi:transcriptional regulator with XRE-family HTH domain
MLRAPTDKDFDGLLAENRFVTDIQFVIEKALDEAGMSQADLARALGISEPRVSQILSGNGKNLQARTIARIAFVLKMRASLEFLDDCEYRTVCHTRDEASILDFKKWAKVHTQPAPTRERDWNQIANDDELEWAGAA